MQGPLIPLVNRDTMLGRQVPPPFQFASPSVSARHCTISCLPPPPPPAGEAPAPPQAGEARLSPLGEARAGVDEAAGGAEGGVGRGESGGAVAGETAGGGAAAGAVGDGSSREAFVVVVKDTSALLPSAAPPSSNGTFINGTRLQRNGPPQQLKHGDVLSLVGPPETGVWAADAVVGAADADVYPA
ncbi:unnamed protein product [Closterium sp. NIES-54]